MDFKLFGQGLLILLRLMNSSLLMTFFLGIVLPQTHLQSAKTCALIEVFTLVDDQLINVHLISSTWLLFTLLIHMEEISAFLVCPHPASGVDLFFVK